MNNPRIEEINLSNVEKLYTRAVHLYFSQETKAMTFAGCTSMKRVIIAGSSIPSIEYSPEEGPLQHLQGGVPSSTLKTAQVFNVSDYGVMPDDGYTGSCSLYLSLGTGSLTTPGPKYIDKITKTWQEYTWGNIYVWKGRATTPSTDLSDSNYISITSSTTASDIGES
jgi:hypothetical protein